MSPSLLRLVIPCLAVLLAGPFLTGCDSSDDGDFGTVNGRIVAADGVTPIPGAVVTLTGAAMVSVGPASQPVAASGPMAITNLNGEFTMQDVPVGPQTLLAQRGSFTATFAVNVTSGTTTVPPQSLHPDKPFAYMTGSFDSIQSVAAAMGYGDDFVQVDTDLFMDLDQALQYAIVFVNCDATISSNPTSIANAQAYMNAGGVIYLSDWAGASANALIDGLVTGDLRGTSETLTATVVHDDLRSFVGQNEVEIRYNLSAWYRISAIPSNAVTLVAGTPTEANAPEPLAIVVPQGSGQLVYTTFHNSASGVTDDQMAILQYFLFIPSDL